MRRLGTFVVLVVVVVVAFFIGRLSVKPMDGNPVGFHLHGAGKIDQKNISLTCSNVTPCNLQFDIYFSDSGAPGSTASCGGASSCFSFHNNPTDNMAKMNLTVDEALGPYTATVYANGAIQGS